MKKTKILKILVSVLLIITLLMLFTQNSFASFVDLSKFDNAKDKSDATKTVSKILGSLINVVQVVAMGVAIIMLIVLGIKWVYESPSGKAQLAKSARYYIIGAFIIFAAVGLLQIIKNFTNTATDSIS